MEHLQHALGDQEATRHVDGCDQDRQRTEDHRGIAQLTTDLQHAADDDDPADRVGDRHQRGVQRRSDVPDDLPADEDRENEDGEVIEELDKEGLRPRIKVMVGGAPITKDWADKIKADGTSEDAVGAVKLAKQLVGKE